MTPEPILQRDGAREAMACDVVVGAVPAGRATAIRLGPIDPDPSVVVLDKGSQAGAHTLSGEVMVPRAMQGLFANRQALGTSMNPPARLTPKDAALPGRTCDIKDRTQNMVWVAPEGGRGPNDAGM
jgi:flavin-dependent dehydrogenase